VKFLIIALTRYLAVVIAQWKMIRSSVLG